MIQDLLFTSGGTLEFLKGMGILIDVLECRDWVPCTIVQMNYDDVVMRVRLAK